MNRKFILISIFLVLTLFLINSCGQQEDSKDVVKEVENQPGKENECESNIDCNDDNACTEDICSGLPKVCFNREIISCINGDNCCPSGCNVNNDNDCSAICGNGIIELGENCDNCPADVTCPLGQICSNGVCSETCTDECVLYTRICFGDGTRVCGNYDEDPCTEYSEVIPCAQNQVCDNGICEDSTTIVNSCSDGTNYGECSENKPKVCSKGRLVDDCIKCGCPSGLECFGLSCIKSFSCDDYIFTESDLLGVGFDTSNMEQKMSSQLYFWEEKHVYNVCTTNIVSKEMSINVWMGGRITDVYDDESQIFYFPGFEIVNLNEYEEQSMRVRYSNSDSTYLMIQKSDTILKFSYQLGDESKINELAQIGLGRI